MPIGQVESQTAGSVTAIGSPISGGADNVVLFLDNNGDLAYSNNFTIDSHQAVTAYALSAKGAYYQFPSNPIPVDAAHNYLYSAIYDDGGNNGTLRIFSQQGPNYWNFMNVDASGNEVSRMTMGDPGDGTVTFSSALWENAVFIIGGFGQGFGSTYMRLTSQFGQGAEFGDALGGQLNINNGTVFVNASGSGGNQGSNVIFQIQDSNFSIPFQINKNDSNGYGDYVQTLNNILDYGNGTAQFLGGVSVGNATPTSFTFQIGDIGQDTEVMYCDGPNQHFVMGDIQQVNYGNILESNGSAGTLDYSIAGAHFFGINNSGLVKVDSLSVSALVKTNSSKQLISAVSGTDYSYGATSAILTGKTGAVTSVVTATSPNDSTNHIYSVGGSIVVTAISVNSITLQVSYTDETSTVRTQSFFGEGLTTAAVSTLGGFNFPPMTIISKPNTAITILTTVTGIGSETYDVAGYIQRVS